MINALLEEEANIATGRLAIIELFAVPRNRRAALASGIVMFMQQFCGINVIAYYSSTVFRQAGFDEISALGATLGFGALNWIAAAPVSTSPSPLKRKYRANDRFSENRQFTPSTVSLFACSLSIDLGLSNR